MTITPGCFAANGSSSVDIRTESDIIRSKSLDISSGSDDIWSASDVFRSTKMDQVAIQGDKP